MTGIGRRSLIAGLAAMGTAACSKIDGFASSESGEGLFDLAEDWHRSAHRTLAGRQALAPEYAPEDRSPSFKGNGSLTVDSDVYREQLARGFPDWRISIKGLVDKPIVLRARAADGVEKPSDEIFEVRKSVDEHAVVSLRLGLHLASRIFNGTFLTPPPTCAPRSS